MTRYTLNLLTSNVIDSCYWFFYLMLNIQVYYSHSLCLLSLNKNTVYDLFEIYVRVSNSDASPSNTMITIQK